jgi:hypothetical protein
LWLIKGNPIKIVLINTVIICLSQFLFFSLLPSLTFQIIFTTLILLPINTVIWFSKMNVEFHLHWLSVYVGFFCATAVFYFVKALFVEESSDFPPGDAYFDLFLTVFILGTFQLLMLLFLNGVTYIINRFIYKNQT